MSPDEQEARSRRYSNDVIMLLPLKSGFVAVFNRGGDLCGYVLPPSEWDTVDPSSFWKEIMSKWHPPSSSPTKREARPNPTLEELFK